jgi:hypothetical protein
MKFIFAGNVLLQEGIVKNQYLSLAEKAHVLLLNIDYL